MTTKKTETELYEPFKATKAALEYLNTLNVKNDVHIASYYSQTKPIRCEIIRRAVLTELARRGWSRYRLLKELGADGKRLRSAIYGWLAGKRHITDASASMVLAVLGLRVKSC